MKRSNVIGFAIGPLSISLLGIVTLPLTTWFFSAEDIGRISLFNVVISLSLVVVSLGLDQSYVREYHSSINKSSLFKASIIPGIVLILVIGAVIFGTKIGDEVTSFIFGMNSLMYEIILVLCIFTVFLTRFVTLIFRMKERGLVFSICNTLPKIIILTLLLSYITYIDEYNFNLLLCTHALSMVLPLILTLFLAKQELLSSIVARFEIKELRSMLAYGFPLVLGSVAYWGVTSFDRFMLKKYSSLEDLALYSVSVSLASAAIILQRIFSVIWAPTVYKWLHEKRDMHRVAKVTDDIQVLVVCVFLIAGCLSPISTVLLPIEYRGVESIVLGCVVVPLFYTLSETTVVGINIARKSAYLLVISIICFILNLTGNFILVPQLGAAGATIATVITFFVFLLLRTYVADRVWISFSRKKFILINAVIAMASIAHIFLTKYSYLLSAAYFFTLVIYCLLERKTIFGIVNRIRNA